MSQNLITAGVIDPTQLLLDQVRVEVAAFLKIPLKQIERLECWRHQIWVKIVESRAKQAGKEWQSAWHLVLRCCQDCKSLEGLAPEIQRQSQEFADLPEVMQAMQELWKERWQELSQATV